MTWWASLLIVIVPMLVSGPIAYLTWKTLRSGQTSKTALDLAQADQAETITIHELRQQVDTLWKERNQFRDDLAAARSDLTAARTELQRARDDLAYASKDIAKLRGDLDRARERITLLEREVARLGGNPHAIGLEGMAG